MPDLTPQDIEIFRKIVTDEIMETLKSLGVDVENQTSVQQDYAFVRNQRLASEQISKAAKVTMIGVFISGVVSLIVVGLKNFLGLTD